MHHAPCTAHHAPCTTLHASLSLTDVQLQTVHSGTGPRDSLQDSPQTPRRRGRRPYTGGSGRFPRSSHSRSPTRRASGASMHPHVSPRSSPSKQSAFQSSTAFQGQPVCALCLATDQHDTRRCRSETLWDGSKARCKKSDEGRLITPSGTTLCSDWNNRRGCSSSAHDFRHECSGCGEKDHGAQRCPRAQKKAASHSL